MLLVGPLDRLLRLATFVVEAVALRPRGTVTTYLLPPDVAVPVARNYARAYGYARIAFDNLQFQGARR